MKKMKYTLHILVGLNLAITFALIGFLLASHYFSGQATEGSPTYTLYIGLNDKDSYTQLIATEEARATVDEICLKHVDAFTVSEAQGCWADETGAITRENTLVYMFADTDKSQITAIMDEVLIALNQSSILVNIDSVQAVFYSGTEKLP